MTLSLLNNETSIGSGLSCLDLQYAWPHSQENSSTMMPKMTPPGSEAWLLQACVPQTCLALPPADSVKTRCLPIALSSQRIAQFLLYLPVFLGTVVLLVRASVLVVGMWVHWEAAGGYCWGCCSSMIPLMAAWLRRRTLGPDPGDP